MSSSTSSPRRTRAPASKPYIRLGLPDHVPLRNRVLGLVVGLPLSYLGVRGLRSPDPVGVLILGFAGLLGSLVLLGAVGTTTLRLANGELKLRYTVLGVPVFWWTLVHKGEATGLRHMRRVGTFFSADGNQLDEHFLVLATSRPREFVVEDLGVHASASAGTVLRRAQERAAHYGLPLFREWDGDPGES